MKCNKKQETGDGKPIRSEGKQSYGIMNLRYCGFSFFSLLIFLGIFPAGAQNTVQYGYDASGNRISRTIVMKQMAPAPQDSSENAIKEQEAMANVPGQFDDNQNAAFQEIYADMLSEAAITIYPNPTKGQLSVRITNLPQNTTSALELFDIRGRSLVRKEAVSEYNELDISHQPVGTYLMQITIGSSVTTWKIIRQ